MASRAELRAYSFIAIRGDLRMLHHFTVDLIEAQVLVAACSGLPSYRFEKPDIEGIVERLRFEYMDCDVTETDGLITIAWTSADASSADDLQ